MQSILTGIYARYSADDTLKAALPGGLFFEMAQQTSELTYATYNVFSVIDYWFAGRSYEIVATQFDIYAPTNALRLAAYEALVALYDDSRPAAVGYTSILMERQMEQFLREGTDNEIYRVLVKYEGRYFK